jgi:hypothetical protein
MGGNMKINYRKKTGFFVSAMTAVLLLLLTACGGNGDGGRIRPTPPEPQPVPESISISPKTPRVKAGDSITLTVTTQGTTIKWPSSSEIWGGFTTNGNQAVYTPPAIKGGANEIVVEFTVTAAANTAKKDTARITVYFPEITDNDFIIPVSPSEAIYTELYGINNNGLMIGEFLDYDGRRKAFTQKDGETPVPIDNPDGVGDTWVFGINDSGHILGYYDKEGRFPKYFLKTGSGYQDLGDYQGAHLTDYTAINNSRQIAGHFWEEPPDEYSVAFARGFVKDGVRFIEIAHPDAVGYGTFVTGINNSGRIAGWFDAGRKNQGFMLKNIF